MIPETDQLIHGESQKKYPQLPQRSATLDFLPALLIFLSDVLLHVSLLLIIEGAEGARRITCGFIVIVVPFSYHWRLIETVFLGILFD